MFVITVSIYTLVCVSFERKRAIKDAQKQQLTFQHLYKVIPALWLFGLLVSVPTLVEYRVNLIPIKVRNVTRDGLSCDSNHMSFAYSVTNAAFVVNVSYVLPVVLMFVNYIQVALFVWQKSRQVGIARLRSRRGADSRQMFQTRIRIVKLLVVVASIFAASWLPFFVMVLYAVSVSY